MNVHDLDLAALGVSIVLLAAVYAVRLGARTGLPSLLLYLGLGVALGESGLGLRFDDFELTTALGYAALVIILAEGGLTTQWRGVRSAVIPAVVLATLGTLVSVGVVAAAARWILAMPWPTALLTGATVSSTDAAAVFSVLRRVPLPPRLTGMLEAESGFNDAPVVIIVVSLAELATGGAHHSVPELALHAVIELAGGAAMGLAVGWLGQVVLRNLALPSSGLYPIAVLALCFLAYGAATAGHTSGFIAVYLTALVLGNAGLPHRVAVRGFAEGVGWLAQIGLFVLLGLLVSPPSLIHQVVPAVVIGLVLLLVARPLSVLLSVSWFGYSPREMAFLSWAGLRGAVPIVLTTIPVAAHADGSRGLFEMVFVMVIVFTLVQAPTLPWVARRLHLIDDAPRDLELESSPLESMRARIMQVSVGPTSNLHGVSLLELRLPRGTNVTVVMRDGQALVPTAATRLRHGDALLVVVPDRSRAETERRLREVSRRGRLAAWSADPAEAATPDAPPRRRVWNIHRPGRVDSR